MRRKKLHAIIEYLKQVEFYHDTFDIEDQGVKGILGEYGVHDQISAEESFALREELHDLAEQNEFREVARMVHEQSCEVM